MSQLGEAEAGEPTGPAPAERGTPAWWDARYRSGDTPWDTGLVPPELQALAASGQLTPGWALDLGCGTGLNSRFLARHGFRVVGIDLALTALARARERARSEEVAAYFCAGSVVDLCFLALRATFALDIGCFHSLPEDRRQTYVASLAARLLPGAFYLLYALHPMPGSDAGPPGLVPAAVGAFAPWFTLRWTQHGQDRERPSAWYLLQRTRL